MLRRRSTGSTWRRLGLWTPSPRVGAWRFVAFPSPPRDLSPPRQTHPAVLVGLYEEPERPSNAVEYLRKYMGAAAGVDVDALRAENERLKAQLAEMAAQLDDAKAKVRAAGALLPPPPCCSPPPPARPRWLLQALSEVVACCPCNAPWGQLASLHHPALTAHNAHLRHQQPQQTSRRVAFTSSPPPLSTISRRHTRLRSARVFRHSVL